MTNNFNIIREYLHNEGLPDTNSNGLNDIYYVVELIRRGKDNPDLPAANYHFKNYYIDSLEEFDKYEKEIIKLCDVFNFRAYVSVNRKSYTKVLKDTLVETAIRVSQGDYKRPYNIWESCSGSCLLHKNVRFVVDIDGDMIGNVDQYIVTINELCSPSYIDNKIILTVPTRSGLHLITSGFDIKTFNESLIHRGFDVPDIKKNHLTLLYENLNGTSNL